MNTDFTPSMNLVWGSGETGHVSRLLALGLRGPRRPVDSLLDRLAESDGPAWIEHAIRGLDTPDAAGGSVRTLLLDGNHISGSLLQLITLKDRCKKAASGSRGGLPPAEPLLGYFFAIAAALAHHATPISSMPRADIDGVLLDLASVTPEPWTELLCRATLSTT